MKLRDGDCLKTFWNERTNDRFAFRTNITWNSDRQVLTLRYLNPNTKNHRNPQFAFLVLLRLVQRDGVLCSEDVFNKSVTIMKQLTFGENKQYWYVFEPARCRIVSPTTSA